MLAGYFEPSDEERERGLKQPTAAHRKIAELVVKGYVRIIVTTNFDRLVETALGELGIEPTVISTSAQAEGAIPLAHISDCYVIKPNGDYKDSQLKNTPEELADYNQGLNRLLDQVLDEYGLIVCGWSAQHDKALRNVSERCKSRRFTTYWCSRGHLTDKAQRLIKRREAQVIQIRDANSFFEDLVESVVGLEEVRQPHPVSVEAAIGRVKRYIEDDRGVQAQDLLTNETKRVCDELSREKFPVCSDLTPEELEGRIERYRAATETLCALFATAYFYGGAKPNPNWQRYLRWVAAPRGSEHQGETLWHRLERFPGLLLLYAAGIAGVAAHHYSLLNDLLLGTKIDTRAEPDKNQEWQAARWAVEYRHRVQGFIKLWPEYFKPVWERYMKWEYQEYLSLRLYDALHETFRGILLGEAEYEKCFDRFEYLLALVYTRLYNQHKGVGFWCPPPLGLFCVRSAAIYDRLPIVQQLEEEVKGQDWSVGVGRLFTFNGVADPDEFEETKRSYDAHAKEECVKFRD